MATVVLPDHWYLVELTYPDGTVVQTIVQYLGIDAENHDKLIFEGYETPGAVERLRVIREVKEG